jgi:hypothetical protein
LLVDREAQPSFEIRSARYREEIDTEVLGARGTLRAQRRKYREPIARARIGAPIFLNRRTVDSRGRPVLKPVAQRVK